MTSIRYTHSSIGSTEVISEINANRGDTIVVPIKYTIPSGVTVRSQLRQFPNSSDYYVLEVSDQNVIISSEISYYLEGKYIFDVEITDFLGIVTTVQKTVIYFIPDITRVYGTEIPVIQTDFEAIKIIAQSFWVRQSDNSLIEIPLTGLDQYVIDAQSAATAAASSRDDVIELQSELAATYHRQFIGTTLPSDLQTGDIFFQII